MNLNDYILQFLEHLEITRNVSSKTIENYHHYLKRFSHFIGDISPGDLTLEHIHRFRLFLNRFRDNHNQALAIKTQNYHIIALRAFLKYLIKNDIPTLSPEKIDLSRIPERTVEYLNRDELEKLFEIVENHKKRGLRDRAILETLYSTGLRINELINLNRSQINLERGEFMVRGKGRKPRLVFLSPRATFHLQRYLATREDKLEPLFVNYGRTRSKIISEKKGEDRRLTACTIQIMVRQAASQAGIIKKVTPHVIRHSYATELLLNGADIRSVQELLGHASITTTQVYTHITDKKLREIHQKYHH